jgi:hypothetical protein
MIDDLEAVERWTGTILGISVSRSGAIQIVIRADDRLAAPLQLRRFFGHENQWDGEVPLQLRKGSRVSFLPGAPRKPGQYPQATGIRVEED